MSYNILKKELSSVVEPITLITLGAILALGTLAEALGRQTKLPRVTILLIFGFLIGSSCFKLLPKVTEQWFPLIANISISMIGFLIGGKLTLTTLKESGSSIFWISIIGTIVTIVLITVGLVLCNVPFGAALLLATIASATAPTNTTDVIFETKARGPFTRTLLGVVAIDEIWALIVFSVVFVFIGYDNQQLNVLHFISSSLWSILGAIIVGVLLGIPMAYLTGRIQKGEPTTSEAISVVLICSGVSFLLHVSFILSSLILGFVVTNLALHHKRPFHAIEGIENSFLIIFFVLSGAALKLDNLVELGIIGGTYIFLRICGRYIGTWMGAYISGSNQLVSRFMGIALLPQAGVALGLALVASQNFPKIGLIVLPIILGTTIIFELLGPILLRMVLIYSGECPDVNNK